MRYIKNIPIPFLIFLGLTILFITWSGNDHTANKINETDFSLNNNLINKNITVTKVADNNSKLLNNKEINKPYFIEAEQEVIELKETVIDVNIATSVDVFIDTPIDQEEQISEITLQRDDALMQINLAKKEIDNSTKLLSKKDIQFKEKIDLLTKETNELKQKLNDANILIKTKDNEITKAFQTTDNSNKIIDEINNKIKITNLERLKKIKQLKVDLVSRQKLADELIVSLNRSKQKLADEIINRKNIEIKIAQEKKKGVIEQQF